MIFQLIDLPVSLLLLSGFAYSIMAKKLTVVAAFTGLFCGLLLYLGAGYYGVMLLTLFFIAGSMATSWGGRQKQSLNKPDDYTKRKSSQVLANAGTATLIALLMLIYPEHHDTLLLLLSASIASALADTLSSELGMLYGRRFYNCITWKPDRCGMDGVISLEGTLIGFVGAVSIALLYALNYSFYPGFLIIIIAGVGGNFCDSFLGASVERKSILNNDGVNFLSTAFAAIIAVMLLLCLS